MFYSDDPLVDFHRYDEEQQKLLERLPVCNCCGEHIQQEFALLLDGDWYCDDCLNSLRVVIDVE